MDTQEIDTHLDDLENRLDRLRSLYEQYFIGIEKLEPAVARKDVDRRFWMLRKLQIRNTARRFRLQVLVQRYNTFQQYWSRICREIENGTYVRHLLKAQKNVGFEPKTWTQKRRLGLHRPGADGDKSDAGGEKDEGAADLGALVASGADLSAEADRAAAAALENAERIKAMRAAVAPVAKREDLGTLDLDFDDEPAPSAPRKPAIPAERPKPSAPAPSMRAPVPGPAQPVDGPTSMPPSRGSYAVPGARQSATPASTSAVPRREAAAAPAPSRAPSSSPSGMTDERVRQLHAQLVASRREQNQAHNVPLDTFAKSIRDTESKLLAQHRGGSVEFHVVVKDGKTIVKPVVRK